MASYAAGGLPAPEFPSGLEWLNSSPLTMAELKGKVVLVNIWDYTCINCIRTLPYLNEWHRRYARDGLVVIGVHTPEFSFAKDTHNVDAGARRFGIEYPVVLDGDYEIWTLYANQYWPRRYLIDANGYIAYDHAGEGDYLQTERIIQQFLKRIRPSAEFPELYKHPGAAESGASCYPASPELYVGYERGRLGNKEGYEPEASVKYLDAGNYIDGYVYVNGVWHNFEQSLKHERSDKLLKDYLAVRYHASSVNVVMRPAEESPYIVYVKQDGAYLADENKGEDVVVDAEGRSYVEVRESRMYRVVQNPRFGSHQLQLFSPSKSFDIYSFTFGSCEVAKATV